MPESSPSPPKILPAALCCGMLNMFCLGVSFPGTTCSPCCAAIICSCMGVIAAPPALDAAAAPSMNGGSPAPGRGAVSAGGSSGPMNPAIRIVEWIAAVIFVVKVCSSSVFFLASSTALALASAVSNFSFCLFHAAQLGPELGPEFPPEFAPFDDELLYLSLSLLFSFLDLLRPMVRERRGDRGLLARECRAPLGAVGIEQGLGRKRLRHDVGVESAHVARHATACPWVSVQGVHGTFIWPRPVFGVVLAAFVAQRVAHDQTRHVSVPWESDKTSVHIKYVVFTIIAPDVGHISVGP